MSELHMWPLVIYQGTCSVPDEVLLDLWTRMETEGKVKYVFYDAGVTTPEGWLHFIKYETVLPVLAVDSEENEVQAIGWLTNLSGGAAYAHFSFFGHYRKGVGERVIQYWNKTLTRGELSMLKVLIGITPETYTTVIKIIKSWGFVTLGVIPLICNMAYDAKRVGGMISYYVMEE